MPASRPQCRIWLVVGLGNPGPTYQATRHNIGFLVIDTLAGRTASWQEVSGGLATSVAGAEILHLLKPQTYMNRSGLAVRHLMASLEVDSERLIVVHDDVDLAWKRLQLKAGGGSGGHKGVQSITAEIGSPDFLRVRVGIGRPSEGSVTDHVLAPFTPHEQEDLPWLAQQAAQAVEALASDGPQAAMNRFNTVPPPEAP